MDSNKKDRGLHNGRDLRPQRSARMSCRFFKGDRGGARSFCGYDVRVVKIVQIFSAKSSAYFASQRFDFVPWAITRAARYCYKLSSFFCFQRLPRYPPQLLLQKPRSKRLLGFGDLFGWVLGDGPGSFGLERQKDSVKWRYFSCLGLITRISFLYGIGKYTHEKVKSVGLITARSIHNY